MSRRRQWHVTCKSVLLAISPNMHTTGDVVDASVHPPRAPSVWYEVSIWECADGEMFSKQTKSGKEPREKNNFGRRQGFMSLFKQVCLSVHHPRTSTSGSSNSIHPCRSPGGEISCMVALSINQTEHTHTQRCARNQFHASYTHCEGMEYDAIFPKQSY
jgi:hypothetical protein